MKRHRGLGEGLERWRWPASTRRLVMVPAAKYNDPVISSHVPYLTKRHMNAISLGCGCQPFKFRVTVRVTSMANCAPPLGPHSRRHRLAVLDGRSREARLLKATIDELTEHVGGKPSATQTRQIARAARIELYMSLMDARADLNGAVLSERDSHSYLAWCNSYRLILRDLGLERRAAPGPSLQEHVAATYGGAAA